jgi:hypothetical protein
MLPEYVTVFQKHATWICKKKKDLVCLQPHQYLMSFTVYCPLLFWRAEGIAPLVHWALGFSVSSFSKPG